MTAVLWILSVLLVVAGIVGIVLPALPGTILIFVGLLFAAWADHFQRVGPVMLTVIGLIAAASYGVDFVAAALGAKHLGASKRATAAAALGTLLGFFLGLPGIIVGPFLGAILGEVTIHRDWKRVGKAGVAAWIGFAFGTAVKVGIAFLMIGLFLAAYLF
jgi:uncharacterized protein YqgC (DUF456 family)